MFFYGTYLFYFFLTATLKGSLYPCFIDEEDESLKKKLQGNTININPDSDLSLFSSVSFCVT